MEKILIVEDDNKIRKELEIFLNNNGYEAKGLDSFSNTVEDIIATKTDLILLDINLPNLDGQYVLRELRKVLETPIIMVTSRDSEIDELLSMNYGADDYVTKPFNIHILLAKISAILKRTKKVNYDQNKINCGEFILNVSKGILEKDEFKIELTKNELKILHFLVKKRGEIVTREEIMEDLWDSESFIDDNTLTVNITRLRNKLEEVGIKELLETKRGLGYILN
ncbi:MAG: response regulator transcription factor [Clostridia bacterium]|nr:response regulator transcription factor [Clostridia bacterium]